MLRSQRSGVLKGLVALAVLLIVVVPAGVACGRGKIPAPTPTPTQRLSPPTVPPAPQAATTQMTTSASDTTPGITGTPITSVNQDPGGSGEYSFNPSEFTFTTGDIVTFTFTAETEFHTFTVDELGIDVSLDPGTPQTVTFTFDTPGTFPLICIPHEIQGMVGTITVTP